MYTPKMSRMLQLMMSVLNSIKTFLKNKAELDQTNGDEENQVRSSAVAVHLYSD